MVVRKSREGVFEVVVRGEEVEHSAPPKARSWIPFNIYRAEEKFLTVQMSSSHLEDDHSDLLFSLCHVNAFLPFIQAHPHLHGKYQIRYDSSDPNTSQLPSFLLRS